MPRVRGKPEQLFQNDVVETAMFWGWLVNHGRTVRTVNQWGKVEYKTAIQGDAGFPDLVMARDGVMIVAELKTMTGRLSKSQKQWQAAMGDHYEVWRPSDWQDIVFRLSSGQEKVGPHLQFLLWQQENG